MIMYISCKFLLFFLTTNLMLQSYPLYIWDGNRLSKSPYRFEVAMKSRIVTILNLGQKAILPLSCIMINWERRKVWRAAIVTVYDAWKDSERRGSTEEGNWRSGTISNKGLSIVIDYYCIFFSYALCYILYNKSCNNIILC